MQKLPTLSSGEVLHMFRDKISIDHPDPEVQLFHSSDARRVPETLKVLRTPVIASL